MGKLDLCDCRLTTRRRVSRCSLAGRVFAHRSLGLTLQMDGIDHCKKVE
jgi:hypothetical protein